MTGKEIETATGSRTVAQRGALSRGYVKHRLIRDLALDTATQKELSARYGVSQNAIGEFKRRHFFDIEEVRNNLADEYAGVWVAQKMERLRMYQDAAEKMAAGSSPRDAEVLVGILKAVAEELGQLPTRTQVQVNQQSVTYQVVGIDPTNLT